MSSISSLANSSALQILSGSSQTVARPKDGDTAAQEAAESATGKRAETQNGGFSPDQGIGSAVNKVV